MKKTLVIGISAVVFGLFFSALVTAIYETLSGIPAGLEFPSAIGGMLTLKRYEGFWWLGVAFCLIGVAAGYWVARSLSTKVFLSSIAACYALCALVRLALQAPEPLTRLGGFSPHWEYFAFYLAALLVHIGAGLLSGYLWRAIANASPSEDANRPSRSRRQYDLGFTLIELLVVIAIIAILASLVFGVIGRSKRSAKTTDDISRLRQVYTAVTLYENDYDNQSPDSLLLVTPTYAEKAVMHSIQDSRIGQTAVNWPANVWVDSPDPDGDETLPRSPYMISFGYLKPFHNRYPNGYTYAEYRNNPTVGMLVDPAVGACRGKCDFSPVPQIPPGQPAYNVEEFLVIRMDGSTVKRRVASCFTAPGFTYEQMFLFAEFGCAGASAGG